MNIWKRSAKRCLQGPGVYAGLSVFLFLSISRGAPLAYVLLVGIALIGLFYLIHLLAEFIVVLLQKSKTKKSAE